MKKVLFTVATVLFAVMLLESCSLFSENEKEPYAYVQATAFTKEGSEKYGMMNLNGEVIIEPQFENEPTEASCDRFFVQDEDDLWELYTLETTPKRIGTHKFKDVGAFVNGLCPVTRPGSWPEYIDVNGEKKFDVKDYLDKDGKTKRIIQTYNFQDGMAKVMNEDGLYGFINETGKMVIEPKYVEACPFYDGKTIATLPIKLGKNEESQEWEVLDRDGRVMFSSKMGKMQPGLNGFENDLTVVTTKGGEKYVVINSKGERKVTLDASNVRALFGNLILFTDDDFYDGLMDTEGKMVIEPEYKWLRWKGGPILAQNDSEDEYDILNYKGEVVATVEAKDLWIPDETYIGFSDRLVLKKDSITNIIIDGNGKKLESAVAFNSLNGDHMVLTRTNYELMELILNQLQLNENGMLGKTCNSLNKEDDTSHSKNILRELGDLDLNHNINSQKLFNGNFMGIPYSYLLGYNKDVFDSEASDEAKLTTIIAGFDAGEETDKLYDMVKNKIQGYTKFLRKDKILDSPGEVFQITENSYYVFIGKKDKEFIIIYSAQ